MIENASHKNKGGRPKKKESERKNKTIAVCFSEREYHAIKHRATRTNLTLSQYCHDAILNAKITEPLKKEDLHILKGIANMGNNLNQIMRVARFTNLKQIEQTAQELLEQIQSVTQKLSHDWKSYKRKKL